jgi:DNA-binding transcriptional LysR family regulator
MDMKSLELLDTVFRTRNLTVAGRIMGLSQPAMSHSLNRLRDIYQDRLYVRLPQGLRPTPLAEQLSGPIAAALQILRGTLEKTVFDPATTKRTFRIALTDMGEQILLPRLVRHLEAHAPGVLIENRRILGKNTVEALALGEVDLVVGYLALSSASVYQQRLFGDRYICAVRRNHPVAKDGKFKLEAFRTLRHVVTDIEGTAHGEAIGRVLSRHVPDSNIMLRINHFLSLGPLLAKTDLVATLPYNLAQMFVGPWKLRLLEPPVAIPHVDIIQYWHERFHHEPGNIWLRGLLVDLYHDKRE